MHEDDIVSGLNVLSFKGIPMQSGRKESVQYGLYRAAGYIVKINMNKARFGQGKLDCDIFAGMARYANGSRLIRNSRALNVFSRGDYLGNRPAPYAGSRGERIVGCREKGSAAHGQGQRGDVGF